ncbi:hypothetical protein ABH926_009171 [Catenulispora sp. GP43]|uniref:hypothetical protein n=1 Tax=Catenulispora sp. GP43 TaxID=3156263 RepID=UPI0035165802
MVVVAKEKETVRLFTRVAAVATGAVFGLAVAGCGSSGTLNNAGSGTSGTGRHSNSPSSGATGSGSVGCGVFDSLSQQHPDELAGTSTDSSAYRDAEQMLTELPNGITAVLLAELHSLNDDLGSADLNVSDNGSVSNDTQKKLLGDLEALHATCGGGT